MKKLLCVICCILTIGFNWGIVNVSAENENMQSEVNYMDSVKGLINTTPDSSVFTKKDGVTYGTVRSLTYYSQTAERETPVNVILPPNYTEDKEYPVLYILHGFTDTQDWMLRDDVALVNMLGNLTASGEAKEMIVVLPYIFCSKDKATCTGGINKENSDCYDNFINDLQTDLLDFIEQSFPIASGRENTAITGFSMGGRESLFIGINMSDTFGYVGAICPAPGLTPSTESWNPGQFDSPDKVKYDINKGVPYLTFIGAGQNDRTVGNSPSNYHSYFENNGNENLFCVIPSGGHNATSVKPYLYNYLRMIFKTEYLNIPEGEFTITVNNAEVDGSSIKITLTNYESMIKKADIIIAQYDGNNALTNAFTQSTYISDGVNNITLENKLNGTSFKIMVWDGLNSTKPLSATFEK